MTATVGFDIGTSSVKVIVVSTDGRTLALSSRPVTLSAAGSGRLEEAPEDWWRALGAASAEARGALPTGTEIRAIGLSGHMSGLVLLDKAMKPVRPCLLLADSRGTREAADLKESVRARIVEQTGNCPSSAFTFGKLLWVQKQEPASFSRATWAVSAKDYILARLTGSVSTEPTDAGNFLLLDPDAARWDEVLMGLLDLPPGLFPPLRPPSQVVGTLTAAAARETGFAPGTPVVAGAADMACAAVGSGTLTEGIAAMSLGTASPIIMPVSRIDRALVGRFTFHPNAVAGSRYALASILSGGRSYQWLQKVLRQAGAASVDFAELDRLASGSSTGAGGVLFLPFLTGTGSPDWRESGRAAWLGIGAATTLAELTRSVLEGVAFNCRECLELFHGRGGKTSEIVVSGGGAKSRLWLQALADVTGLTVRALEEREASALGAAVLAAAGCGQFSSISEAAAAMVRRAESRQPEARQNERYGELYTAYLTAKRSLVAVDEALAVVRDGGLPT